MADEGAAREQPNPVLPKTMSLSGLAPARVSPPEDRDTYSVTALADITDRSLHAAVARFNGGWPRRRRREAPRRATSAAILRSTPNRAGWI